MYMYLFLFQIYIYIYICICPRVENRRSKTAKQLPQNLCATERTFSLSPKQAGLSLALRIFSHLCLALTCASHVNKQKQKDCSGSLKLDLRFLGPTAIVIEEGLSFFQKAAFAIKFLTPGKPFQLN